LYRRVEVLRAERDVLDALTAILLQVLLDLPVFAGILVDGNANLAVGAGHRARVQARQPARDVEVADLAEVEDALVEARPLVEPPAMHVVREVVDVPEPVSGRLAPGPPEPPEVHVVDRALRAVAIHQVDVQSARAFDGGDTELVGPGGRRRW